MLRQSTPQRKSAGTTGNHIKTSLVPKKLNKNVQKNVQKNTKLNKKCSISTTITSSHPLKPNHSSNTTNQSPLTQSHQQHSSLITKNNSNSLPNAQKTTQKITKKSTQNHLSRPQTTTNSSQSFSTQQTSLGPGDVYMTPRVDSEPSTFARRMMTYWFQDYERGKMVSDACRRKWFVGHPVLDKYMVYEFGADFEAYKHEKLSGETGPFSEIERHPLGALSLIILITQYPKSQLRLAKAQNGGFLTPEIVVNSMYGPTSRLAHETFLEMVYNSIQTLHPLRFDVIERLFFFLPLLQVENRITQKIATARLSDLVEEAPRVHKPFLTAVKEFGLAHLDVVTQFNRFPQRNVLMGRESTEHEKEYLKLHTSDWEPVNIYQFVNEIDGGLANLNENGMDGMDGMDGISQEQREKITQERMKQQSQQEEISLKEWNEQIKQQTTAIIQKDLPTQMKNPNAWK